MGKWCCVDKRKGVIASVAMVAAVTIFTGIYFKHYFAVFAFAAWGAIELMLWGLVRGKRLLQVQPAASGVDSLASLLHLYGKDEAVSEQVLETQILRLREQSAVSEPEYRWLWRLRDLLELKGLLHKSSPQPSKNLYEGFAYSSRVTPLQRFTVEADAGTDEGIRRMAAASQHVANLYWRALDTASGNYGPLTVEAKRLLTEIFGEEFEAARTRQRIQRLTDSMQRHDGVPFLILNLIRRQGTGTARDIAQAILLEGDELEHDLKSSVYWIAELSFFVETTGNAVMDFDATIRHLYHICFVHPDRAGFLEIDSKYFAQFELVSELAREGFLFKESLVESLLQSWRDLEPFFDSVFQRLLERMTQRTSKIYDEREAWEMIWRQEREGFNKEYLYVVEGNVLYAAGQFRDAALYYEKALRVNPSLRSALLNALFAYAQLHDGRRHGDLVAKILGERTLLPAALSTIANSYILMGDLESANDHYQLLSEQEGWDRKSDYYRSMFLYDQGMFAEALASARQARDLNPADTGIRFHLSLCFSATGHKAEALEAVAGLGDEPDWLRFYRFTLERDIGLSDRAAQTLLDISREYFDDADELEQALDFARSRRDLVLLRHLRFGASPA